MKPSRWVDVNMSKLKNRNGLNLDFTAMRHIGKITLNSNTASVPNRVSRVSHVSPVSRVTVSSNN